ncbi:MAG: NAD-dependent DNA ligase LigA, partial [Ruminococcus flavefaciens]|nr:NAD-dependent DNA ligase LigA [Ruminococcus flavefaciens]
AVNQYKNRDEFKASVEARGGKVAGSVSKRTDFLVNNDSTSTSGKNKKANELGIPVITEQEFIGRFGR